MAIYTNALPVNEQQTAALIKERIGNGSNELIVGKLEQEIVYQIINLHTGKRK